MRIRKEVCGFDREEIELVALASDALAHPCRVEMFRHIYTCNIRRVPVCNKDLVAEFSLAQSTVSQHMKKLLASGLVETRRQEAKTCLYVNVGMLQRYIDAVRKLNSPLRSY